MGQKKVGPAVEGEPVGQGKQMTILLAPPAETQQVVQDGAPQEIPAQLAAMDVGQGEQTAILLAPPADTQHMGLVPQEIPAQPDQKAVEVGNVVQGEQAAILLAPADAQLVQDGAPQEVLAQPERRDGLEAMDVSEDGKQLQIDEGMRFWRGRLSRAVSPDPNGHRIMLVDQEIIGKVWSSLGFVVIRYSVGQELVADRRLAEIH
jgi:hypothetical protein